jgi:hypothetical protein
VAVVERHGRDAHRQKVTVVCRFRADSFVIDPYDDPEEEP